MFVDQAVNDVVKVATKSVPSNRRTRGPISNLGVAIVYAYVQNINGCADKCPEVRIECKRVFGESEVPVRR